MQAKFRPSLSLEEIQYLIVNLNTASSPVAVSVRSKLQLLTAKVNLGLTKPAFITSPKEDIMNQLGESNQTPAQKRESAYIKYHSNPAACTDEEVKLAKTYMYNNNMMTATEREAYEEEFFGDL